ncbi:MAG: hypothetical protein NZ576_09205, partial [Bacteroidia bacterium]|nr:hypothetical protein [Bacteroidia bacterium]
YFVAYRKVGARRWEVDRVAALAHELTGLSPCSEYEVQIRSGCAWGFPSRDFLEKRFSTLGQAPELEIRARAINPCTLSLKATPGFAVYSWSVGATSDSIWVRTNKTYTVIATDSNGCTAVASYRVNIDPAPYMYATSEVDEKIAALVMANRSRILSYLDLVAIGLAGLINNSLLKDIIQQLTQNTASSTKVVERYHISIKRLSKVCDSLGLDLKAEMVGVLVRNGISSNLINRFLNVYQEFKLLGDARVTFYPAIYFPYLNPAYRADSPMNLNWDGKTPNFVTIGVLFPNFQNKFPYYFQNERDNRIHKIFLEENIMLHEPVWEIVLLDNLLEDRRLYSTYKKIGGACICDTTCPPRCGSFDVMGAECGRYILANPCDDSLCPQTNCPQVYASVF